jgi:hypothetical protein
MKTSLPVCEVLRFTRLESVELIKFSGLSILAGMNGCTGRGKPFSISHFPLADSTWKCNRAFQEHSFALWKLVLLYRKAVTSYSPGLPLRVFLPTAPKRRDDKFPLVGDNKSFLAFPSVGH